MLFWILLFGPLLFLVVSLVLGQVTPNYSPKSDEMSYLIYGKYGAIQTLNFLVSGVLSILLAIQLSDTTSSAYQAVSLVQAGALMFGVSLVLLRVSRLSEKARKLT